MDMFCYAMFAVYTIHSMHYFWMLEITGWLWNTVSHNQDLQYPKSVIFTPGKAMEIYEMLKGHGEVMEISVVNVFFSSYACSVLLEITFCECNLSNYLKKM